MKKENNWKLVDLASRLEGYVNIAHAYAQAHMTKPGIMDFDFIIDHIENISKELNLYCTE